MNVNNQENGTYIRWKEEKQKSTSIRGMNSTPRTLTADAAFSVFEYVRRTSSEWIRIRFQVYMLPTIHWTGKFVIFLCATVCN